VVGRDVLIGAALGVAWVLMVRGVDLVTGGKGIVDFPGAIELLSGLRSTSGVVVQAAQYAIRNVLLFFFLLFLLRLLLRSQWPAALAYAAAFGLLSALGDDHPWIGGLMGFLYFGSGAFAMLRWGLLTFAVGTFVSTLLMSTPATLDGSAWYFGNMLLLLAIVVALASWGLYTSISGRLLKIEALG